jgi:hypothetical protein
VRATPRLAASDDVTDWTSPHVPQAGDRRLQVGEPGVDVSERVLARLLDVLLLEGPDLRLALDREQLADDGVRVEPRGDAADVEERRRRGRCGDGRGKVCHGLSELVDDEAAARERVEQAAGRDLTDDRAVAAQDLDADAAGLVVDLEVQVHLSR